MPHLIVTDSGVGGLSVCAEVERRLREGGRSATLTYFNAWPEPVRGYNDFPTLDERGQVFDLALNSMAKFEPDRILIACNTLSIVYPHTAFSRAPRVPVVGIVEAGVDLFHEALTNDPSSAIVLTGTITTIESGVHRAGLIERGIDPSRIAAVRCHGLAAAVERGPDSHAERDALIEQCMTTAAASAPRGRLFLGLCCTHYTYIANEMKAALERHCGRRVEVLDPNRRMVDQVLGAPGQSEPEPIGAVSVSVLSKVAMAENKLATFARLIEPVSPLTAKALLSYSHEPRLF